MADTPKRMCEWKKGKLEKDFDDFAAQVKKPKYACMKCARVSSSKKRLCKPAPLK